MPIAAAIIAFFCALWFVQAAIVFKHLTEIRTLSRMHPAVPAEWPRVSVIIPARNEAMGLRASLESRLGDGYPDLELVVVDDRSADATPDILAGFARDPRVVALRVDELPDGWLGKVHALDHGLRVATGEWLLFSDADVVVAPGALATAVAHCEADGFDVVALVPEFRSTSGIVNVLWAIFVRVVALVGSADAVRDPGSKAAVGSGGWTLVRRSAYEASPGFSHLRLETADDMALGAMLKAAGARCDFVNGRGSASVSIYASLGEFYRGVEKNGSSLANAPFLAVAAVFALLGCIEYSPLVALGVGLAAGVGWLAWLGAATIVLATVTTAAALRLNTGLVAPALAWPVGWALMASGVLRSAWLVHRRGGVVWRGTFYPKAAVMEAQRFRIG